MKHSSWVTPSLAQIHATLIDKKRSHKIGNATTYTRIEKVLKTEQAGRAWKSLTKQARKGKIRELIEGEKESELLEPQSDFSDLMLFVLDWRKASIYIPPDGNIPTVTNTLNSFLADEELIAYALIWISIESASRSFLATVQLTKKERQEQLEEALNQLKGASSKLEYLTGKQLTLLDILKSIKLKETGRTMLQAFERSSVATETLHKLIEKAELSAFEKSEINEALDNLESSDRALASVLVAYLLDELLIPHIDPAHPRRTPC